MLTYFKQLGVAARKDTTTYVAAVLAGLSVLPEVIPKYWSDVEGLIPTTVNKETVHHILLGVGALAAMWLRAHSAAKASTPQ